MKKEMLSAGSGCVPRESAVGTLRSGMAKDKLIFIIICSAAIGVAVITIASSLLPRGMAARVERWQCRECGNIFKERTFESPPIECPKCSGQAATLRYRTCPQCGQEIVVSRWRLTEEGKAQEEAARKAQEEAGGPPGPWVMPPPPMGKAPPVEVQYWAQQSDDSYAWTNWLNIMDPRVAMISSALKCEECHALLYP